jgi:hypothetical protein
MRISHPGVLKSIAKPYLIFRKEFGEKKPSKLDNKVSKKPYPERRLGWTIYPGFPTFYRVPHASGVTKLVI